MNSCWDLCVLYKIMAARADQICYRVGRQIFMLLFVPVNINNQYVRLCSVVWNYIYIMCDCIFTDFNEKFQAFM